MPAQCQRDEVGTRGQGAVTNYRGPGPKYVAYVFVFFLGSIISCRLYKLTLSDQAQVPSQVTVSLSYFM